MPDDLRARRVGGGRAHRGDCVIGDDVPAVVLGGHTSGLAVIRALGSAGVPVIAVGASLDEPGQSSRYCSRAVVAPHPEDDVRGFVDFLLALANGDGRPLLVPTSDETVAAVARHKPRLEEAYTVACMDRTVVEGFLDKWATLELAQRLGVPAPLTFRPESAADLERRREELVYPCLVKPRESHVFFRVFGKKMDMVEGFDELLAAWRAADAAGIRVMVQEFVPGPDSHAVNYNAYVWDGRILVACTAQRLRSVPPHVGFPRVVVSRSVPEVAEPAARLLAGMGISGFANVEFKKDERDGAYKLMEVNGRHNMSAHLSVRCGVNFPAIEYDHRIRGVVPHVERFSTGVYWINFPSDVVQGLRSRKRERYGLRDQLRPYLRPHVFDMLSTTDPRPFAASLRARFERLARRLGASAG